MTKVEVTLSFDPQEIQNLPQTGTQCPRCKARETKTFLCLMEVGARPDNFLTYLICPVCYYCEQD